MATYLFIYLHIYLYIYIYIYFYLPRELIKTDDLLALENKLKTDQRHLQFVVIEVYKSKKKKLKKLMWKAYNEKNILYSLGKGVPISILNVNSQKYGINLLNFGGSVLWNNLPMKLKNCNFLQELSYY